MGPTDCSVCFLGTQIRPECVLNFLVRGALKAGCTVCSSTTARGAAEQATQLPACSGSIFWLDRLTLCSVTSGAVNYISCLGTVGEAALKLVKLFALSLADLLAKFPDRTMPMALLCKLSVLLSSCLTSSAAGPHSIQELSSALLGS